MAETSAGSRLRGAAAEAAARQLLEGEGLPFPVVPDGMAGDLQQFTPTFYATCELPNGLWNVDALVDEAAAGKHRNVVAFGFEGHGVESWAFHYFLADADMAVVLQLRWGGAFADADQARGRIEGSLEFVRMLQGDLRQAVSSGKLTAGRRVAVLETDFSRPRWAWVTDGGQPAWDFGEPVLFNALMSVRDLLEGS